MRMVAKSAFVETMVDEGAGVQQRSHGNGVGGRHRAVEEFLRSDHERLGVAAGGEEAAGRLVPEQVEQLVFVVAGADKQWALDALLRRKSDLVAWQAVRGCRSVEIWTA